MSLMFNGPLKSGKCFVNGSRTVATPGAMELKITIDRQELEYVVPKGSHHEAAYVAAMTGLILMDAQGFHVVEVETPNEVVVNQMNKVWAVGSGNLLDPYFSLRKVCELFNKVTFTKV